MLGGCSGFIKNMKVNKVIPDIKIFTQLLEVIPSTLTAENVRYLFLNITSYIPFEIFEKQDICIYI